MFTEIKTTINFQNCPLDFSQGEEKILFSGATIIKSSFPLKQLYKYSGLFSNLYNTYKECRSDKLWNAEFPTKDRGLSYKCL